MSESRKVAVLTEASRELYEASVIDRMNGRCGLTPNGAKGVALEVMDIDKLNLKDTFNPERHTQMTKNPHAKQLDAVTIENGKIVKRYQYKDTPNSWDKTIKQVQSGKYDQATLRGTKESAEQFNMAAEKIGVKKRMESTGISTKDTKRVADKYLTIKNGTISSTMGQNLCNAAKTSAIGAVGLTAAIEVGKSILDGDDFSSCANHVVSKGAESAVSAVAASTVGEVAFATAALVNPVLAVPAALVGGVIAGTAAGEIVEGVFDGLGDVVEDAIDDIRYGAEDLFETAGDVIENISDNIKNGIDDILFNIGDFFGFF